MRPWFTVGALALAERRGNAVGAVRLTLGPAELEIELVQVAGFAFGFAPGGVAEPVTFRVPFTAVRGLLREGRVLYLTFDPAVVTPYNRFALAAFAEDPASSLARAFQARSFARAASALLPVPLALLSAAVVPEDLVGGVLGRGSLAALVAIGLFAALRSLWAARAYGDLRSERLRDRFEAELGERLALVDVPVERKLAPSLAVRLPPHRRRQLAAATPVLTRVRPAESARPVEPPARLALPLAAAALAAAGVVGVMAFLQRYAAPRPPPPAVDRASTGIADAVRAVRPSWREPPPPERCTCTRADSPLWKDGIPALAVLTFHGDEEGPVELAPTLDKKGFPGFDFDLAVINDGARPLHDVRLTLTFARRSASGQRVGAVDRGLFWEGVLAPGAAVKWKVKAPGSEMRTDASVMGTLDKARLEPAPADAFFRLASSHFRAVRVHGAMMLAYLRDPRAEATARALSASSATDDILVGRIRRAAAPVFACEVRRSPGRISACVFNASSSPRSGLALREVTAPGKEGARVAIPLPVHEGRRIDLEVPEMGEDLAIDDTNAPE